ncbi:proton-conducting transporter membrane subunit [Sulfurospirillum barnesii]|uniref:Formate hydrogenlyase subunit 3/multisubunit Na+/H+ antiporter, MnhD subunit n=1 Tax=Sulfurospirillum barnesii (strain ATCC 700032 / DSM 10660 / SES-3) TaxID=760154 RepID=I3XZ63_SULBS|nr:proton-conducting transporter membrane subunit [Sulfurospirillum barnesii]AFL69237.1 formate hydrogenlyase subunit 3/multisubunit Na+/H+ antiporter, MnhD subunit [Sulfurospirillum barnesii SES-3]
MQTIYTLFLLASLLSLLLYKKPLLAQKVGFGLASVISLYAAIFFFSNLHDTLLWKLPGSFISAPLFRLDSLGMFFSFLVSLVAFAVSLFSFDYAKFYENKANLAVFASLFNAFILSMLLVIASDNVFSFMLLWEVMTLISALLILINDGKDAGKNVMIYLGIAQIGAFCLMVALLIMASFAGSFEFSKFAEMEIGFGMSLTLFVLLLIGLGSKAGMFPFHVWLPLAYCQCPSNASALMSGVMIKVALFAFIKFSLLLPSLVQFGYILLFVGALSCVFGIIYALVSNDYKAAIAYSSCENVGIIFLGLGGAFYGLGTNSPTIALLGFVAGFFHILNHAVFKSLLFMLSGNVYTATQTRNMDLLGGLHKKMPITSIIFFVAVVAICALPPLNGFASEWVVYKTMVMGGIHEGVVSRFFFTLAIIALSITGAMAIMAFSKVYGAIFLGVARDTQKIEDAKEVSFIRLLPLGLLASLCVGIGVFMNDVIGMLSKIVFTLIPQTTTSIQGLISMPIIIMVMLLCAIIPFVLLYLLKANHKEARITDPWACGFLYNKNMQIGSNAFTGDIKKALSFILKYESEVKIDGYFSKAVYTHKTHDLFWEKLYVPVIDFIMVVADKIGIFQNGRTNLYAGYILIYLCLILMFGYYYL